MEFYIATLGSALYSALWIFVFFSTLNSTTSFLPSDVNQKRKMIWVDIIGNTAAHIGLLVIVLKNNVQYLPHILFPMCWYWACEIRDLIRNKSIYFDYVPLTTIYVKSSNQVTARNQKKFGVKTHALHTYPYTINATQRGIPGTIEFIKKGKRKFHPYQHTRNNETFPIYFADSEAGCLCIDTLRDPGKIYPYDTDYFEFEKITRENAQSKKQLMVLKITEFFSSIRILWLSKYKPVLRLWQVKRIVIPRVHKRSK